MNNKQIIQNASDILENYLKGCLEYTYSKKTGVLGNDLVNNSETTQITIQNVMSSEQIEVFLSLKSDLEELFTVHIRTNKRASIYYHFPFCFAERYDFLMKECFIVAFKTLLKQINIEL